VVFLSLADSEILSPVIMGFRRDNASDLLSAIIRYAELELQQANADTPKVQTTSTLRVGR
jgi:hypothetical protein